jgi:hypothetical protein
MPEIKDSTGRVVGFYHCLSRLVQLPLHGFGLTSLTRGVYRRLRYRPRSVHGAGGLLPLLQSPASASVAGIGRPPVCSRRPRRLFELTGRAVLTQALVLVPPQPQLLSELARHR